MNRDRTAGLTLAAVSLVAGIGLLLLTAGDGLVTGERGPRLGAFVDGNLATALLFTGAGLIAAFAATRLDRQGAHGRLLLTISGGLLLAGAALHLLSVAVGTDLLGGSGSTVAAFLGLGAALTAIGLTPAEA